MITASLIWLLLYACRLLDFGSWFRELRYGLARCRPKKQGTDLPLLASNGRAIKAMMDGAGLTFTATVLCCQWLYQLLYLSSPGPG